MKILLIKFLFLPLTLTANILEYTGIIIVNTGTYIHSKLPYDSYKDWCRNEDCW